MNIGQLFWNFMTCLSAARAHYALYKIVDWNHDMIKYNTEPEHFRDAIYTDFSANPNLSASRTSTGAVDSHGVIAIFITFQYKRNEDRSVTCTKNSHIFIGGSESKGKKNNWMFHIACLKHLIEILQKERPSKEVTVMTDRCPGQYLCRQTLFQIAKLSAEEGMPNIRHLYAVVHRFKGDHDAEGKVVKERARKETMGGKECVKPWDFYRTVNTHCSMSIEGEVDTNKLKERHVYFGVYDEEEFEELNVGEHEGKIVFIDMVNTDDTKRVDGTTDIYTVQGFSGDFVPPSANESSMLREAQIGLYEVEKKNSDTTGDDEFLEQIEEKEYLTEAESARKDFIELERGYIDSNEFLTQLESKRKRPEYMDVFLTRAGKSNPPKSKDAKMNNMKNWLSASPVHRLYILRGKGQIKTFYTKMTGKVPTTKAAIGPMISAILGTQVNMPKSNGLADEYFLWKSNLPCSCHPCLSHGPSKDCLCPMKKYMKDTYITVKLKPNKKVRAKARAAAAAAAANSNEPDWEYYDRVHVRGEHNN